MAKKEIKSDSETGHDANSVQRQDDTPYSWRGFMGLVSFSTILPINIHTSIHEMAKFTFLWPLIGGFIGIIVGSFAWLLVDLLHLSSFISAALIYTLAISFTGFHHLDGLMDFGDGLMAHGSPEKKIEIMRDKRMGTGGLAALLTVALVTFTSIASLPAIYILPAIFVSEVAAKMGLITCATFTQPHGDGTGSHFVKNMNWKLIIGSLTLTLVLGFLALNYIGIIGIIGGLAAGLLMANITTRTFKWATGDILGASNEIGRMASLLFMVIIWTAWW